MSTIPSVEAPGIGPPNTLDSEGATSEAAVPVGAALGSPATSDKPMGHIQVAIIGGGFGGIGAAVRMGQMGADFILFERSSEVGGTWSANRYPGCACDIPSVLYSFSFAPEWPWTRRYAPQEEILAYLHYVVHRFDLTPRLRLEHEVTRVGWDDSLSAWRIETSRGSWTADTVIAAYGALSEPRTPNFKGLEDFEGRVMHSARWDPTADLTGRTVAVIGTGASAAQIVPAIASQVEHLVVFQRTPPWVMPRCDRPARPDASHPGSIPAKPEEQRESAPDSTPDRTDPRRLGARPWSRAATSVETRLVRWLTYWQHELKAPGFVYWPGLMRPVAWRARRHLRSQVPDPHLRRAWEPHYTPGCKRILFSDDWYPALQRDNVEVVESPIQHFEKGSIVTDDGCRHRIDTVVTATGFSVGSHPMPSRIFGSDGRSLLAHWIESGARHYLGTLVPGFPNLFLVTGPNTGVGHTSLIFMIESQLRLISSALRIIMGPAPKLIEIRPSACDEMAAKLEAMHRHTVWSTGGCNSWYLDSRGHNSSLWPSWTWRYRFLTRKISPDLCVISPRQPLSGGSER